MIMIMRADGFGFGFVRDVFDWNWSHLLISTRYYGLYRDSHIGHRPATGQQ